MILLYGGGGGPGAGEIPMDLFSKFSFSASETGFNFSVSGNKLTITTENAPADDVTITASRSAARCGVLVWTDNKYGPNGGVQDTVTYTASVSDPVKAFIKLKVSYGSAKIIKTSEDGKVDGINFTVVGDGVNQTVTRNWTSFQSALSRMARS